MDLMRKHVNLIWKRQDFIWNYNLRWTKRAPGKNEDLMRDNFDLTEQHGTTSFKPGLDP